MLVRLTNICLLLLVLYCNEIAIKSKSSKQPVVLEHSQAGLRLELNTFSAGQLANSTDKAALLICFIHRIVVRSVGYLPD